MYRFLKNLARISAKILAKILQHSDKNLARYWKFLQEFCNTYIENHARILQILQKFCRSCENLQFLHDFGKNIDNIFEQGIYNTRIIPDFRKKKAEPMKLFELDLEVTFASFFAPFSLIYEHPVYIFTLSRLYPEFIYLLTKDFYCLKKLLQRVFLPPKVCVWVFPSRPYFL
jgi:hypothetical protein